YQVRLSELREELEEAEAFHDSGRIEKARQEMETLLRELRGAVGLAGRDRRVLSPSERARVNLTKTISAARHKIAQKNPSLGNHLQSAIRTGTFFSYIPDPDQSAVSWEV
ncbi:MAG: hypothetical protein ACRERD_01320, partial [Candidatus Binatia bacterium]